MNWLDILIIVVLVASAVGGLISGFIRTVFSLAGFILGVFLAGRFYIALANIMTFIPSENGAKIVAFIIIFLIVTIIFALLGVLFTKIASLIMLGWINRLLGAALGVIMGGLFLSAILAIVAKYTGSGNFIGESVIATLLLEKLPLIMALLPAEFDVINQFFN